MQTILLILLLALEAYMTVSHEMDPYCRLNISNNLRCCNWNSTEELNQHILNLALEHKHRLEDFHNLTVAKSNNFDPNMLSVAPNLKQLALTSTNLAPSFAGFIKFSTLEYLVVDESNLEISENTFLGLTKLNSIGLLSSNIKYLPENWQNGFITLTSLSLPGNYLKTINYKSFKGLYSLEVLNLSHNDITDISADAFGDLTNLTHLFIINNKIGRLPTGLFDGVQKLQALDVSDNSITCLEPEIFKNLKHLKDLTLDGNAITVLNQSHFVGLHNLEKLDLDHNNITMLSAHLFKHSPQIVTIKLNFNNIAHIQEATFAGLSGLQCLDLSDNDLGSFPIQAFDDNCPLVNLNLANNRLRGLDNINCKGFNTVPNLPSPKTCIYSNKLTELTTLNLQNNDFRSLELDNLEWFPKLKYIQLDGNSLDLGLVEKIYHKYEPI